MHQMATNPGGTPSNLRVGNPKSGVALAQQRIRMPDQASADRLEAHLKAAGRSGRAAELGRLLALALKLEAVQ